MIDPKKIKKDFPILKQKINGHPLVYLNTASTSLTPVQVVNEIDAYYNEYNASVHRGLCPISEKATYEYENAREKTKKFINAKSIKEVIFTKNTSESINLVAYTWGRENLSKGDVVVLSVMEHHSNIIPWQIIQKEKGFKIIYLSLTKDGRIDLEEYKKILKKEKVKLVSLLHQSNVLGTINPIKEMISLAHKKGAKFLVDAAQSIAHQRIDVINLDADFLAFSGHKMCGPTGIGVLYGKEEILNKMPPFLGGGNMIKLVCEKDSSWSDLPAKYEAGTPNIAQAIGLGAAIDYLDMIGFDNIQKTEKELAKYALEEIKAIPNAKIIGPNSTKDRGATFSFEYKGVHPHDIATILGEKNICARAGHHCAQPLMNYLGIDATTRISLYFYNTKNDIDKFVEGMNEIKKIFSI